MAKIITNKEAQALSEDIKKQGKTLVFTNGCFDILHIGHVKYLQKSAKLGDYLMIGLNSDSSVHKLKGSDRPVNPETDRAEVLAALEVVDYVTIFNETSPASLLAMVKPSIYTKGKDYTLNTLPERDTVLGYGGRIEFIDFVEGKSTTNVLKSLKSIQKS